MSKDVMAVNGANALTNGLNSKEVEMILSKVDTTGLTEEEKNELALALAEDYAASKQGFDFRPQRYKVNKDNQTFTDPLGTGHDEIRGVVVFKQKTRGYWEKGDNNPLCSSFDAVSGIDRDGNQRSCVGCPQDQWGSATDGGEVRKGKACKEMRRAYIIPADQFVPIVVSVPPTSITPWDNYFSARITQGIPDLAAEAVMSLIPGNKDGFTFSIIKLKNGAKVAPKDMLEYNKVRKQFASVWERAEITADDYADQAGDVGGAGAGTGQASFAGGVDSEAEPY